MSKQSEQGLAWLGEPAAKPAEDWRAKAADRQTSLTKPPGSLGRMEDIAITLAGLQGRLAPRADCVELIVFAADHGITAQGVSPYPSDVTAQMLKNFERGGAAISVMAQTLGARLQVVDVGVRRTTREPTRDPIETTANANVALIIDKCSNGARDFSQLPALSQDMLLHGLAAGARAVDRATDRAWDRTQRQPCDVIAFGDMGIGNTTAASAVTAALLARDAADVTGPGTGLDRARIARKAGIIRNALALHQNPQDPLDILKSVGGLELAAIAGAAIRAAQRAIPVIVDGFIVTASVAIAVAINPTLRPWLIFAHRSAEPGHRYLLDHLDADPLLDLDMRLGEGTGAAAAIPLIRMACALHNGMATFAEAGVADESAPNDDHQPNDDSQTNDPTTSPAASRSTAQ